MPVTSSGGEYASRRSVLKLLGAGATGTALVGSASAGGPRIRQQLRGVRKATEKYRNIRNALDDGYEIMGPYVPNMGWHVVNFDRIPESSPEKIGIGNPAGLTYNLQGELGAVEYILPLDDTKPDIFNDEDANLKTAEAHGWHPHHGAQHVFSDHDGTAECGNDFSLDALLDPDNWIELSDGHPLFPPEQDDLHCGDTLYLDSDDADSTPEQDVEWGVVDDLITHGDWWTLHAWVHFDNPAGVFAPINPAFDAIQPNP